MPSRHTMLFRLALATALSGAALTGCASSDQDSTQSADAQATAAGEVSTTTAPADPAVGELGTASDAEGRWSMDMPTWLLEAKKDDAAGAASYSARDIVATVRSGAADDASLSEDGLIAELTKAGFREPAPTADAPVFTVWARSDTDMRAVVRTADDDSASVLTVSFPIAKDSEARPVAEAMTSSFSGGGGGVCSVDGTCTSG